MRLAFAWISPPARKVWTASGSALNGRGKPCPRLILQGLEETAAYRDEAGISWWQNERLLCVTLSYVSYTGGAHPSTWRQAVSFDLSTGKTVSVTDLATDINQLEEAVYQLILRQIQDSGDTSYFSDYDKTVLDWIERSVFYNAKGVTIVFNTYDIAPYSAGEQTFFIPYDLVKPYLNDYGLHLLELDT